MTSARSLLVDPDTPGFYHCISRRVRRAWLCGVDPYNGKSYEHRRGWVEQRLLDLAKIFSVGVYAYAVMSNQVHVVLRIDPNAAATWPDDDFAVRWVRFFPATIDGEHDKAGCRTKEQTLLGNADYFCVPAIDVVISSCIAYYSCCYPQEKSDAQFLVAGKPDRGSADAGELKYLVVCSQRGVPVNHAMGADGCATPNPHMRPNHCERPHADAGIQLGRWVNQRGGMNQTCGHVRPRGAWCT